jgi:hypothetical protein
MGGIQQERRTAGLKEETQRARGRRRKRKCQRKGANKVLERERYKEERDKKGSDAERI